MVSATKRQQSRKKHSTLHDSPYTDDSGLSGGMAKIVSPISVPIVPQAFEAYSDLYEIYSVGDVNVVPKVSTVTIGGGVALALIVPFWLPVGAAEGVGVEVAGQYSSWTVPPVTAHLPHPSVQLGASAIVEEVGQIHLVPLPMNRPCVP